LRDSRRRKGGRDRARKGEERGKITLTMRKRTCSTFPEGEMRGEEEREKGEENYSWKQWS
jgi:hypothetical protein